MFRAPRSTLYILRHAHSSWALPGQRDHQRPLDERGRGDAPKVGAEIARAGYEIHKILCSTAVRAVETLAAIRGHLGKDVPEETSDDLYALGVDAYFAKARENGATGLMIIGHNPMIEDFTLQLAASGEPPALETLRSGFPTAGLAVIDFDTALPQIAPGSGRLRRLIHPRDLAG